MNNSQFEETEESGIDLRHYYILLRKHRFLIITCLVLYVAVNLYFTLRMMPIYQSSTTLMFEPPRTTSPFTGEFLDYETYTSQYLTFNTHTRLITNRPVLERVMRELRLDQPENKDRLSPGPVQAYIAPIKQNIRKLLNIERRELTPVEREELIINGLRNKIDIKGIEDTRLMQIIVEDTDPVLARDIANTLARAYIQFNITNSMQASQNSFQTLQDQSYELKKKLEDADRDFLDFKQDEQLFSITGKQEAIAQKISEFNALAVKNRSELQELTARLNELQSLTAGQDLEVVRIRSLLNNPVIDRLNEQLIEAEIELSKLRKVYRDIHPKVVKVLGAIEDTKKEIKNQVDTELANMKNQQSLLLAKEKNLQKNIAELEKESLELGQKEVRYGVLQRNVDTNQRLYDTLMEKLSESDISDTVASDPIRIVEAAQVPLSPVRPDKRRNILISIAVGLLIGIGLAFFVENLDRTIQTEDDVQKYFDLAVLSVVPIASQAGKGYGYGGEYIREAETGKPEARDKELHEEPEEPEQKTSAEREKDEKQEEGKEKTGIKSNDKKPSLTAEANKAGSVEPEAESGEQEVKREGAKNKTAKPAQKIEAVTPAIDEKKPLQPEKETILKIAELDESAPKTEQNPEGKTETRMPEAESGKQEVKTERAKKKADKPAQKTEAATPAKDEKKPVQPEKETVLKIAELEDLTPVVEEKAVGEELKIEELEDLTKELEDLTVDLAKKDQETGLKSEAENPSGAESHLRKELRKIFSSKG
jgi:uncharacterized protein involved in exopolysaccharide biosynthesis